MQCAAVLYKKWTFYLLPIIMYYDRDESHTILMMYKFWFLKPETCRAKVVILKHLLLVTKTTTLLT